MAIVLPDIWNKSVGDTDVGAIDMAPYLDAGDLDIYVTTGEKCASLTVVELTTTALTIANVAVSTAALIINGVSVPIGKAVQFSYLGMAASTEYKLLITVTTDSTPARVENFCQRIWTAGAC